MADRPILFSWPMVRAIREGKKTQTRRTLGTALRFAEPGDRLWVRETFAVVKGGGRGYFGEYDDPEFYDGSMRGWTALPSGWSLTYQADWMEWDGTGPWRPSIHMPRWASRITLEVLAVRKELLNSITEEDAVAEGCEGYERYIETGDWRQGSEPVTPSEEFQELWEAINGNRAPWASNPYVHVIEFREVRDGNERKATPMDRGAEGAPGPSS